MADYQFPGVYLEEYGRGPRPIAVPTDIAGFAGVTHYGPDAPTLITSWTEFQHTFGGFVDHPPFVTPYWRLAYAARGFFENGGARLYVARVLDAMAPAGAADLEALVGDHADPGTATGIAALMAIAEISLMAVPDDVVMPAAAQALLERCHASRDRIAIVNAPSGAIDLAAVAPPRDTAFGAYYYPHLHVPAPHLAAGYAVVPPCGHVAGGLAQVAVGSDPHHAAAELADGGLLADDHPSGVGGLERPISAADASLLVPRSVNVLRNLRGAGRGIVVWSGRTMSSDPEWKYVHIRRLFIYLERSIEQGLRWVAFEPNRDSTWTAVRESIADFLAARWRDGALAGATVDEAFFVKCDRTTMTQDDIDHGRLVCVVGAAPVRPAEFVIIRIGRWTADACP